MAVRSLRVLGTGHAAAEALMAQLQHEQVEFAAVMSPADMKQRHYRSYNISGSRDPEGKARRRVKAS